MSDPVNRREMLKLILAGAAGAGLSKGLEYTGLILAWADRPAEPEDIKFLSRNNRARGAKWKQQ